MMRWIISGQAETAACVTESEIVLFSPDGDEAVVPGDMQPSLSMVFQGCDDLLVSHALSKEDALAALRSACSNNEALWDARMALDAEEDREASFQAAESLLSRLTPAVSGFLAGKDGLRRLTINRRHHSEYPSGLRHFMAWLSRAHGGEDVPVYGRTPVPPSSIRKAKRHIDYPMEIAGVHGRASVTGEQNVIDLLTLTTEIVAAHVANNTVAVSDLPQLLNEVYKTLTNVDSQLQAIERPKPAVPVKKSVHPDYIICLENGKKLKMLKRYLKTAYDMTPEEYRERWGLPTDYPMVAPNYAQHRSTLAKKIGLGTGRPKKARGKSRG